ncbi:unnamed protein product [Blepharisma stoltei]|uniref:RING-type domain-containing protein n=1 Tax=Blepharisma stoltei TaxID=1481888 RepID=A0AAU9K786_9CILI|nr:unnamed protein product [Blepharisma stoltei]
MKVLEINQLPFFCSICRDPLKKDNYWKIIEPIYDFLLAQADQEKYLSCKNCGIIKEISEFHDNLCKECFAFNLRSGKVEKWDNYTQEFISEKGYCDGCKKIVYFVKNCLTSICPLKHYYCRECLVQIMGMGNCLECKRELSEETKIKIDKILYAICKICGEKFKRERFIPKRCCEDDVCVLCQIYWPSDNCCLCNKELSSYALEIINDIREKIKN